MSKPGNWEVVGGDPAPGDPTAFDHLYTSFQATGEAAGGSSTQLQRLAGGCDDSIWSGEAADAFREQLGKLPGDLAKLHDSYNEAACGLQSHAAALRDMQRRAGDALDIAVAADEEIRQAEQTAATPTISAAGPVIAPAGPSPAEQALEAAKTRLANAKTQIHAIYDEHKTAEGNVIAALDRAHNAGIKNKAHHFWSGITDPLVKGAHAVGDELHKSLRAIGDIADRFSDVFTVVALLLSVVAFVVLVVGTGGVAAGVVMLALEGAEAMGTAAAAAKFVSVGAEATSKAAFHDKDLHWGTLAKEGALAAGGIGVGKLAKGGLVAAKAARGLVPFARDGAEAGAGLSILDRAPDGVKRFVDAGKTFGKDAVEKAKPLIDKGKNLESKVWGTEEDPKFLKKGVEDLGKMNDAHDLQEHYGDNPRRLFRPLELGAEPSVTKIPCLHSGDPAA